MCTGVRPGCSSTRRPGLFQDRLRAGDRPGPRVGRRHPSHARPNGCARVRRVGARQGRTPRRGDFLTLASGYGHETVAGVLSAAVRAAGLRPQLSDDVRDAPGFERGRPDACSVRCTTISALPPHRAIPTTVSPFAPPSSRCSGRWGTIRTVGAEARRALDASLDGERAMDPTAAGAIVTVAARHGDAALFEALVQASRHASSHPPIAIATCMRWPALRIPPSSNAA